ncbi:MAG: S8 family serine peptidase [Betaproteobacteria bacterium]|nr:S8 family serine peptidase [Betaproteobacteria bacterium]
MRTFSLVLGAFRNLSWGRLAIMLPLVAHGAPLTGDADARLTAGKPVRVIVEYSAASVDRTADDERSRRHLVRDDARIRDLRAKGYDRIKADVDAVATGTDGARVRDYSNLPMSVWRLSSQAALKRLLAQPGVVAVHEDVLMHPVGVSDLGFINQPQTASQGATGAGTVIAVIDGGLGTNYQSYTDFGTCTGVGTPADTCRVVYDVDYYPGASTVVSHGTNVSAIALGVAPGAKLAMYDVYNGGTAATSDILAAMNHVIANVDPVNYNVVAVNLSLGDGTSHALPCDSTSRRSANYSVYNAPVAALANAGVITVAAAGNNGSKTGVAQPACAGGVVSVGAVFDKTYSGISWGAPASCTDAPVADLVACFSQSASYLTMLAPGTFVDAPTSAFRESGTSQATPHVSGAVAVLRARYPAEPLSQTLQRLTDTGVPVADPNAGNQVTPRLDLLAATNEATVLTVTGTGPSQGTALQTGTYALTVTNSGPLIATGVSVTNTLPAGATFVSASAGCTQAAGVVTCTVPSLAVGAAQTFDVTVQWNVTGPVYATAAVAADQGNAAPPSGQQVAFGTPAAWDISTEDVPLPMWANVLLAGGLIAVLARAQKRARGTI